MATIIEIYEKVKAGEVVAIPSSHFSVFVKQLEIHGIDEASFKIVMNRDKCLIGPIDAS